jgi:molybdopterin-containing oxidoreductase family iron-sulfur binding subunit
MMTPERMDRQRFLRLMGASLGLAGLTACGAVPAKGIVPYVRQPEEIVPGKPLYYATATTLGGYARGALVKTTMGRPIKVEGNPDHPASLGATDVFGQAEILTLYDPDRSQTLTYKGEIRAWNDFLQQLTSLAEVHRSNLGGGMRVLTETVTSPSLADQLLTLRRQFPNAGLHQYDPVGRDNARAGAIQAFGEDVATQYHFDRAQVILSLDADFLGTSPGSLRHASDFARTRQVAGKSPDQGRLYVVESSPTITGAVADNRWPVRASDISAIASSIATQLGMVGVVAPSQGTAALPSLALSQIVEDLRQHPGSSLIVVGESQPPELHALGHRLNQVLGNVGTTVYYTGPIEASPVDQNASIRDLTQAMDSGQVDFLLVLGANPVYATPIDLHFGDAFRKVASSIHLGLYQDETAALATWHVPQAHEFESWSDARAFDGTSTVLQPLIAPLYGGRTANEILAIVNGQGEPTSLEVIQGYWRRQVKGGGFEQFWRRSLNDGFVAGTALPAKAVELLPQPGTTAAATGVQPVTTTGGAPNSIEVSFRPDATIHDGRYANNAWLQELPKPLTQLTWDNVAMLSATTAERLDLSTGQVVELRYRGRSVRAPILITPAHPDDAVTLQLGFGRTHAGKVGNGVGYNAYLLRTSDAPWFASGLEIMKTGDQHQLATTQGQQAMEGRPIVLDATLQQYRLNPRFAQQEASAPGGSLYPPVKYPDYAWGMAIDLTTCIGCKACEIACQAENNIPVVGKQEVQRGRIMHWIRVDRYNLGNPANPVSFAQPVPCMQCENAPCELVCPVVATVHSDEGLNDMVYNRCVGTRYCSNNCPYKVRRFNFYQYADWTTPSLKLLNNPNVSVRERGVMEKCTYCVQRITSARIQAEEQGRPIRDGDVVTACQAACPTRAIVFGNINDPNSAVAKLKSTPLNYTLLGELNTRPRTTYLAAVRNPNPAIKE